MGDTGLNFGVFLAHEVDLVQEPGSVARWFCLDYNDRLFEPTFWKFLDVRAELNLTAVASPQEALKNSSKSFLKA